MTRPPPIVAAAVDDLFETCELTDIERFLSQKRLELLQRKKDAKASLGEKYRDVIDCSDMLLKLNEGIKDLCDCTTKLSSMGDSLRVAPNKYPIHRTLVNRQTNVYPFKASDSARYLARSGKFDAAISSLSTISDFQEAEELRRFICWSACQFLKSPTFDIDALLQAAKALDFLRARGIISESFRDCFLTPRVARLLSTLDPLEATLQYRVIQKICGQDEKHWEFFTRNHKAKVHEYLTGIGKKWIANRESLEDIEKVEKALGEDPNPLQGLIAEGKRKLLAEKFDDIARDFFSKNSSEEVLKYLQDPQNRERVISAIAEQGASLPDQRLAAVALDGLLARQDISQLSQTCIDCYRKFFIAELEKKLVARDARLVVIKGLRLWSGFSTELAANGLRLAWQSLADSVPDTAFDRDLMRLVCGYKGQPIDPRSLSCLHVMSSLLEPVIGRIELVPAESSGSFEDDILVSAEAERIPMIPGPQPVRPNGKSRLKDNRMYAPSLAGLMNKIASQFTP